MFVSYVLAARVSSLDAFAIVVHQDWYPLKLNLNTISKLFNVYWTIHCWKFFFEKWTMKVQLSPAWLIFLPVTLPESQSFASARCLPVGLMKASSSVMGQCCHPLSSHSVICLAPSPLQEHFPSACKMITGWLLDFPLFFSVYSPFLPSSHLLFSLSQPLCCSPAHPSWHITLIRAVLPLLFSSFIMLPFFRCSFPP